jgi:excisionase family DNA binding protein
MQDTSVIVSPVGQVYTTEQIATILQQVHRRTVQRLIAHGELQAMHVGRRLRVTDRQPQAFVAKQEASAPIPPDPAA